MMKTKLAKVISVCLFGIFAFGVHSDNASAWIGTGVSGGGGGGGGGGGSCGGYIDNYGIGCAGVSWAFYKAQWATNSNTVFPSIPVGIGVYGATIPAECSQHDGGGFWHFGINGFNIYYYNDETLGIGGWYGHWHTMDSGLQNIGWSPPYNTTSLSGRERQWVGPYMIDRYGSWGEVLSAYQIAYQFDNPGAAKPSYIPGDVWGFCYWPGMEKRFQGLSKVNNNSSDWAGPGSKVYIQNLNNCSITNGCTAKFDHYLKRVAGSGDTNYHIDYSENNMSRSGRIAGGSESGFSGADAKLVNSNSHTLYPGQYMCQTLYFDYDTNTKNVSYKVCALALHPVSGGTTELSMGIRNDTLTPSGSFVKSVYAKPNDNITFKTTYRSGAQYPYRLGIWPQRMQVNGGGLCASTNHIGSMLQSCGGGTWANGFLTTSENFVSSPYQNKFVYSNGDDGTKTPTNTHKVTATEVGRNLVERSATNTSGGVNTVPKSVGFVNNSNYDTAVVDTGSLSDSVQAYVPYNFKNSTTVTNKESNTTLYSGESITIHHNFVIEPKPNSLTTKSSDEKYATTIGNPKTHLEMCVGGSSCENGSTFVAQYQTADKTKSNGLDTTIANMWTGKTIDVSNTINVPDIAAGTRICLRSAVWPATSGSDSNWNDPDGDHKWAYSAPVCFTVAKKPSIQIWGGNVYSSGKISTATSTKGNLADYNTYGIQSTYTKRSFGSWAELGIISNGKIKGLSSGASMGYGAIDNGVLSPNPFANNSAYSAPNPGGSAQSLNCKRSPLTFANNCSGDETPAIGNSIASTNIKADKSALINKYIYGTNAEVPTVSGIVSLNDGSKLINGTQYYYGDTSVLTIPKTEISANSLQIVHSTGNIFIDGDINYHNEATYTLYSSLPKLILYAEKNIYINCSAVSRIDAVMIAGKDGTKDGIVKTCADIDGNEPDVNSQERSHQLSIYGAVIANKLVPNRTYGAATGANSIVPAEIINFDPTLYLWGGSDAATSEDRNTNMDVTYLKEVAPRY